MASRYLNIINKLNNNETVLLDGGIGTELEKRGIKMDATWSGSASLNTEILTNNNMDYNKAGSQIITTNTYPSPELTSYMIIVKNYS